MAEEKKEKKVTKAAAKPLKVSKEGKVTETKPVETKEKPQTKKRTPQTKEKKEELKLPSKKLSKEKAAEKVTESKDLANVIKQLKERNEPASEKEVTKLAKDTIKLVAEAQRSGSLAFKRESTKALVQIRNAVDRMAFSKDANKEKLISDIDSVVLDSKNVTLYMVSAAKAQVEIIKEKGKAEAKQIKVDAAAKVRVRKAEAKAEAKRIQAQADLEAKNLVERTENELKVQRAEQTLRIKRIRAEIQDRAKRQKDDADLRELAFKKEQEEARDARKEMTNKRLIRLRAIKDDFADKKARHAIEHKERMMLLKQKEKDLALDYRSRRDEAKAKVQELYRNIRESQNGKADRQTKSDAHSFLKKVGEGAAEANPLLMLGYTLLKGMKDTAKLLSSRPESPDKKSEKKSLETIERIYSEDSKEQKRDDKEHHEEQRASKREMQYKRVKVPGATSKLTPRTNTLKPATNAPQATPKAGTVQPSIGESNAPSKGGIFDGIFDLIGGFSSFFSGISGLTKVFGPLMKQCLKFLPGVGLFAVVMNSVLDFLDGFTNATKLFTDDLNPSFIKKVFAGLTNVGANLLGIVDSIAGFFGIDLDLKGFFQDRAKAFYESMESFVGKIVDGAKFIMNAILVPFRWAAGNWADLLVKLPFVGEDNAAVKMLRDFSKGGKTASTDNLSNVKPQVSPALTQKQKEVNRLEENVNSNKTGTTTAVVDNSVKSSNTTIVGQKLSTRNDDHRVTRVGWGSMSIGR